MTECVHTLQCKLSGKRCPLPQWINNCYLTFEIAKWEQQEEQREFTEACRVANNNLWLCDDGAP